MDMKVNRLSDGRPISVSMDRDFIIYKGPTQLKAVERAISIAKRGGTVQSADAKYTFEVQGDKLKIQGVGTYPIADVDKFLQFANKNLGESMKDVIEQAIDGLMEGGWEEGPIVLTLTSKEADSLYSAIEHMLDIESWKKMFGDDMESIHVKLTQLPPQGPQ